MRAFTATLGTETNTFSPIPTDYDAFGVADNDPRGKPDARIHPFASVLLAARERARTEGWELVEGPIAFATPAGPTTRRAYERLRDELLASLRAAMPVDIVLLGLHGAMVADGSEDAEGELLACVRGLVGPGVPIGAELDPHCHLTPLKCANADVLVCFKEYPHTDILERAREVVALTAATRTGAVRPVISTRDCAMIAVFHTSRDPMRAFVERIAAFEGRDGVLSVSIAHGFPWGDVPGMGTRVMVITDDRRAHGDALARTLGHELVAMRDRLLPAYLGVDEALERALAIAGAPVVLADSADNAGGGAASDSTFVLQRLVARAVDDALVAPLWDPMAVRLCFQAGEGARMALRIGGKTGPTSGDPLDAVVEVRALRRAARMHRPFGRDGSTAPLGDCALVRIRAPGIDDARPGIDVLLNSERTQALGDPFVDFGVDWTTRRVVVLKSSQHFHAVFGPPAAAVFYVETPGSVTMDWARLPYRRRSRPLWPFER